ncbi:alpha/beta hydrolase [Kitasatospora terrestris]|uniref:Alpha/beta hydrolase n=1 Tax=Kitasatospora terrestris TaxID=258051 RepID=A0ABP9EY79_9ACTN
MSPSVPPTGAVPPAGAGHRAEAVRTAEVVRGRDGTPVTVHRWTPAGRPRGVVQLSHGVGEHARRYDHLARTLAGAGWAVQGQDHRGHGLTAAHSEAFGRIGAQGWAGLVDDLDLLVERAHRDLPGLPVVLLGHSTGSFAAQQYVLDRGDRIAGLVLSGTTLLDVLEPLVDLDLPPDLSVFNAPFAPARTPFDWLSRDEAQVDAYLADPACGFGLDPAANRAMFTAARAFADPGRLAGIRPDLPVHLTVGEADPLHGGLALVRTLVERLHAAGLTDVTLRVWPGARHEVLNETVRAEVEADLLAFVERVGS